MVTRFYKDLRLGTTLVHSSTFPDASDSYTLVRKAFHVGYELPHELAWLRHSSGDVEVLHFQDGEAVQHWLDLYDPTENA